MLSAHLATAAYCFADVHRSVNTHCCSSHADVAVAICCPSSLLHAHDVLLFIMLTCCCSCHQLSSAHHHVVVFLLFTVLLLQSTVARLSLRCVCNWFTFFVSAAALLSTDHVDAVRRSGCYCSVVAAVRRFFFF
ncbi:hypothetical protein QVD17_38168 [Tagetes erecta]|uniref:Uncharacterized protein n=1 Tax=Tagetes erecta TaxID=13708 RepID=A0AAD8JZN7_TARER|nr:hypothetical protein QVD17_38168 [Tagetes erecta]